MEREKWLQEQEKNGNSDVQDAEDSQFFQLADRTLQRMSSKDETANHSESLEKEKIFKSPPAKFGPLQPLQNLVGHQHFQKTEYYYLISSFYFRVVG